MNYWVKKISLLQHKIPELLLCDPVIINKPAQFLNAVFSAREHGIAPKKFLPLFITFIYFLTPYL